MKTCPSCGYSNDDDATYCVSCGAPLSSADGESIVKEVVPPTDFNYDKPVKEDAPPADYNYSDSLGDNGPISTSSSLAYGGNGGSSKQPGSGLAKASLALGIISFVCVVASWMYLSFGSIILGIIGLALASSAKKEGNTSGVCTAGFVTSLIGLILGVVCFGSCAYYFAYYFAVA